MRWPWQKKVDMTGVRITYERITGKEWWAAFKSFVKAHPSVIVLWLLWLLWTVFCLWLAVR